PVTVGSAVTVVVPNWNGRRWLAGCLEALAAQTHAEREVIVVDNASTDGSREYLRAEHRGHRAGGVDQHGCRTRPRLAGASLPGVAVRSAGRRRGLQDALAG